MGKGSSENKLPEEVFAVLPKDPDQQLEVASQITQIAVSGRVAKLEAETSNLTQQVAEKDAVINGLLARVVGAETTLAETTMKLAVALEGQAKLIDDKNELTSQVKKLMCQGSKLDKFKKALVKSLEANTKCVDSVGDENEQGISSSRLSLVPSRERVVCNNLLASPMSKSSTPPTPTTRKQQAQFSCMMPVKVSSNLVDSNEASNDGCRFIKGESLGLCKYGSTSESPRLQVKLLQIDGKEFFRQARNKFSYEQFSEFLSNFKELNSLRQAHDLNTHQMDVFHPITSSCKTHVPPNSGDWIYATPL